MSITRITQSYVRARPQIRACLRNGLINYSALARLICEEVDVPQFDAVLMAVRRYAARLRSGFSQRGEISEILRQAKIEVRNKVAVIIIEHSRSRKGVEELKRQVIESGDDFHLIEGRHFTTIVTSNSSVLPSCRQKGVSIREDLVLVSMMMDPKIERTPGVVAHIYGLLYEHGVNLLEEMSSFNEVMFVLEKHSLPKALEALEF